MDHQLTLDALAVARRYVDELHDDDVAERWWARGLDLPDGVAVSFVTMGNNPERVRELVVIGDFDVDTLRAAAATEQYIAQADVWDLDFPAVAGREVHRRSRVDTGQQGGPTDRFSIRPSVEHPIRQHTGSSPGTVPAPATSADAVGDPPTGGPSADLLPIGSDTAVPPFDFSGMLVDRLVDELATLRARSTEVERFLVMRPVDDGLAVIGAPPGFVPVLGLMVDGATLGYCVDAEETGRVEHRLVLYEFTMSGAVVADDRLGLGTILERQLNDRWSGEDAPPEVTDLAAALGLDFRRGAATLTFSMSTKRSKPRVTTGRTKWRNDRSGNGVLAPVDAWGTESIRRPASIDRALTLVETLRAEAPAAALYCAHEALALANERNDVELVGRVYTAMVEPLRALGRDRVAGRADAMASAISR